jgi:thiol-disulfide isomerase/thioredoxin
MKKIGFISTFLLVLIQFGCSTDFKVLESIEAISIGANTSYAIVGETITLSASTNSGTEITDETIFYVNELAIEGNTFTTAEIGSVTVKAKYFSVISDPLVITFHDGSELNYVKRVLIEDYTGTWCGYCPRVSYAIEKVQEQTEFSVPVAIHRSSSNPSDANYDPFNYDTSVVEALPHMPAGYPKGILNRITRWTPLEQNNIPQVLNLTQGENPKLGVAMDVQVGSSSITLDVKVQFSNDFEHLKLVVFILENGLIYDQVNYYSQFYGGSNPIPAFEHNHVLRASITPLLGENIPNNQTVTGNTYIRNFQVAIPPSIQNINKLEFVAFVTDGNTNRALNVRKAVHGDQQSFETF